MKKVFGMLAIAIISFGIIFMYASCQQSTQEPTYADLSEEEKAVVDFIWDHRSSWKSAECGHISFTDYEGSTCLYAFYLYSQSSDSYVGTSCWYKYNVSRNTFEEVYSQVASYSHGPAYTSTWNNAWSEPEAKEYITEKYTSYLSEK